MIDEIDYFPKRERHNKNKKVDSGWSDLKKQKNKQDQKNKNKMKNVTAEKKSTGGGGFSGCNCIRIVSR